MAQAKDTELEVGDPEEWRAWLAEHHDSESGVWLVYHKGGRGGISYASSVDEALCFGWIDGLIHSVDETRYARRFTPRRPGSTWSSSNKQRVDRLMGEERMTEPGRAVIEAAKADGSWNLVPDAERAWSMPAELEQALEANRAARRAFESSPPSHRRRFVMWVASAKRAETRQRRAVRALEMLLAGERPT